MSSEARGPGGPGGPGGTGLPGGAATHEEMGGRSAGWTPADPGPLGLAAFAMTTFVLSMYNSELVGAGSEPVVLGLALAYGGIAQFVAGIWEFRTGNTFGSTAFCSYGAFWISFWALNVFYAKEIKGGDTAIAAGVGLYLWAWGIFTAYMFIASLRTTGAVALVFLLLAITFIVLGIENAGGSSTKLGGYLGLATAVAAWYASFAAVTNHTFGKTVLPVVPLSR